MPLPRVRKVVEQIRSFTPSEKEELFKTLLGEKLLIINTDYFTKEEIAEIRISQQEVAHGEWVDFDEFRRDTGL